MTEPSPIDDKEPQVTSKLRQLLESIRAGTLSPSDFAYVRAGFFPNSATFYQKELQKLGTLKGAQLLQRREAGDDRIYLYQLTFANGTRYIRLGLAPDDRVSAFSMRERQ